MSLLSEEKIKELALKSGASIGQWGDAVFSSGNLEQFARAIEAAVLAEQAKQKPVYQVWRSTDSCEEFWSWDDCDKYDYDHAKEESRRVLYAAPVVPADMVMPDCRAIADQIVRNLEGRKRVIDLDLEEELVEEIMQEMTETIRSMVAAAQEEA